MKKLPIGRQTFSELRLADELYIDKTEIAYELITTYRYAFLSRPRRFGKSLFVTTLKELFEGSKKLFEGLYVYDKWDWEDKYPVIKIDFYGDLRSPESLEKNILHFLKQNQKNLEIVCDDTREYDICFEELIEKSYEKYKKPVVILIDEYDKAILDNLDQMEVANANREILRAFYSVMKGSDRYIKFVFLTGVSKFSKASIFSGLNMLEDISLVPKFGNICGYTQNDIETTFEPYLKGVDLEQLKRWYDGYSFLKDNVYNPFNILLFIKNEHRFKNYWFNTGTPNFLVELFKEGRYNLAQLENRVVGEALLDSFEIENLSLETVMFQSGYLTIKESIERRTRVEYRLDYPNLAVKMSFSDYLLNYFVAQPSKKNEVQNGLIDMLEVANLDNLEQVLKSLFASIAYHNFTNNYIQNYEGFYASVIYAYFAGAGFDKIKAEDVTNGGRIDLSVFIDDKVYIFEFKVNQTGALNQIKAKKYHERYLADYNEIYIVGVEFDSTQRNIIGYEWEMVKLKRR
jgi:hypothetical protein